MATVTPLQIEDLSGDTAIRSAVDAHLIELTDGEVAANPRGAAMVALKAAVARGSLHTSGYLLLSDRYQVDPYLGAHHWIGRVTYARTIEPDEDDDPVVDAPTYTYSTERSKIVADYDINGDAIVKTNGELYDPPLERVINLGRITVTFSTTTAPDVLRREYFDVAAINSDEWLGEAAYTVMASDMTYTEETDASGIIYRVQCVFLVNQNGWRQRLAQYADNYLPGGVAANGLTRAIDPKTNQPMDRPIKLTANGDWLADDQPYVFKTHNIQPELPFAGIIPTTPP